MTVRLLALAALFSLLLAGCVAPDGTPEETTEEEPVPQFVTKTWDETFTGTVTLGRPGQMDETGTCQPGTAGEEDVNYVLVPFEVTHVPSAAQLTLSWDGNAVQDVWFFPDLELRLLGPDGAFLDECEGITGTMPEALALSLNQNGTHKAMVMGYAGATVDFELRVQLTYAEPVAPAADDAA